MGHSSPIRSFRHLYGPVPSRRLGRSLGIDLVPHKVCTCDCIYCQIGKTTEKTLERKEYVSVVEILEEVKVFLGESPSAADFLSLGGSGEPTLHSGIRSIIQGIKSLTSIPVAVITNGFLLCDPTVREDLLSADAVLPSLDAASEEVFQRINRPCAGFSLEGMIAGMSEFRESFRGKIWLEILFCKGVNDSEEELQQMKGAIGRIRPDRIDLNTVVRPPSEKGALPLGREEMERIRAFFGEKAEIIAEFNRPPTEVSTGETGERILRVLERRPLSVRDISLGLGIPENDLNKAIEALVAEGKVRSRHFGDVLYYETQEPESRIQDPESRTQDPEKDR
jgi:wyosine [tRNA(Phe)-imidazoG37] synthetase (radical SAM superfamily)